MEYSNRTFDDTTVLRTTAGSRVQRATLVVVPHLLLLVVALILAPEGHSLPSSS